MREQTSLIGDICDLEATLAEAKSELTKLDWNTYHDSIASRQDALRRYTYDIAHRTATVLDAIGNAGLDAKVKDARKNLFDVLIDRWDDEFAEGWEEARDIAEEGASGFGRAEDRVDAAYQAAAERRVMA